MREYKAEPVANGKIQIAIQRLAEKYILHVKILERMKIVARPEVGTVGVAVSGDDILLLHNPEFVLDTPLDQLTGVLLHEVHHVLFRHILIDPVKYPDTWALTVATEVTVNEFVREPLPAGVIELKQFPKLPPMESTERRYQRLKQTPQRSRQEIMLPADREQERGTDGESVDGMSGNAKKPCKSKGAGNRGTVDNHGVWNEALAHDGSAEAIDWIVNGAVMEVGHECIPEDLKQAMGAAGIGIGNVSSDDQYDLAGGGDGQLDWQRLLRIYVGRLVRIRPVFNRPARRFPELVGIVPGRRRQGNRPKIMAVIDTSGSIDDDLLELINAELARMARDFTVIVVECDTEIHGVYRYKPLRYVTGRGGTDLRPPLRRKFLQEHSPDLVVYFTDGEGPAHVRPPRVPVVWCLVPDGTAPADWGHAIKMETTD